MSRQMNLAALAQIVLPLPLARSRKQDHSIYNITTLCKNSLRDCLALSILLLLIYASTFLSHNSIVLLLDSNIIKSVDIIQPQLVVDPFHPRSVLGSKGGSVASKIDIQFFQCFILGLRYHQPYEQSSTARKAGEEDVRPKSHAVNHVTCGQAYDEVELGMKSARESK